MLAVFFSVLASLISVVNPFGAVPVYLSMTPHYTARERTHTVRMTALYFMLILLSFFWFGSYILSFFGISINAMRIAGGFIILMSGYGLLKGQMAKSRAISDKVTEEAKNRDDISFAPLAMPLLSGPGSISLLIALFAQYEMLADRLIVSAVIVITGVLVYIILISAPMLFRVLGFSGLKAISRIMGFLVMSIGIQYMIYGLVDLTTTILG